MTLNNTGWNCTGPLVYRFLPIQDSAINVFSPYDFLLLNTSFTVAYLIVKIQSIIHITYKLLLINCLCSVRLLVNSRLFLVKFRGVKSYVCDIQLHRGQHPKPSCYSGVNCIDKIEKLLEKYNLPKVTSEEIEDPNSPIALKEI